MCQQVCPPCFTQNMLLSPSPPMLSEHVYHTPVSDPENKPAKKATSESLPDVISRSKEEIICPHCKRIPAKDKLNPLCVLIFLS